MPNRKALLFPTSLPICLLENILRKQVKSGMELADVGKRKTVGWGSSERNRETEEERRKQPDGISDKKRMK